MRILTFLTTALAATPVVIWHGLGDRYDSPGMQSIAERLDASYPGIYVHAIALDEDGGKDQQKSLIGNVRDQVQSVCDELAAIPELSAGFNAIGFSQGGLFLRSYVELCPSYNSSAPQMKRLITFGSPHNGIADLPLCGPRDYLCKSRNGLFKSQVWSNASQTSVVVAQYFRDPARLDQYLDKSGFLADINNEREHKNSAYSLSSLDKFVMIMFSEDTTVVPRESAWFQEVDRSSGEVTDLEDRAIYKEDWIGLKKLGKRGALEFVTVAGQHMEISDKYIDLVAEKYLGDDEDSDKDNGDSEYDEFSFAKQAQK